MTGIPVPCGTSPVLVHLDRLAVAGALRSGVAREITPYRTSPRPGSWRWWGLFFAYGLFFGLGIPGLMLVAKLLIDRI